MGGRHYTPAQRKAIMATTEFKQWKSQRQKMPKKPGYGYFHAFMTDVGKEASPEAKEFWSTHVNIVDSKGIDNFAIGSRMLKTAKHPKLRRKGPKRAPHPKAKKTKRKKKAPVKKAKPKKKKAKKKSGVAIKCGKKTVACAKNVGDAATVANKIKSKSCPKPQVVPGGCDVMFRTIG